MEWRKPPRCLNGSAARVMCEWQTVLGILLNPERSMKLRTITQNTFIVRSLTAQRVRFRWTGLTAGIDHWRNYGSFPSTGQYRYGNPIQLHNCALRRHSHSTLSRLRRHTVHTGKFISSSHFNLFLQRDARAYSKRVPRTNCAPRIKKCAPRISSGIYFFM